MSEEGRDLAAGTVKTIYRVRAGLGSLIRDRQFDTYEVTVMVT